MQLTMTRAAGSVAHVPIPPGYVVRPIAPADLRAVGELYWRAYPADEVGTRAEAIDDVAASWRGDYGRWLAAASLLAERDGEVAAAILTVDSPPWADVADLVFIIDLFTAPEHRGSGLGAALVAAALAAAPPGREVGLRVESDNLAAVHLYERLGFRRR